MSDTITALATPPGTAGLAVIRLSGDDSFLIADKCFSGKKALTESLSHTAHFGKFYFNNKLIDTVVALIFKKPASFTGENVVEFSCHGGMLVVEEIINALIQSGARYANAGEFTKRAFLNGKLDLMQVEAVADIIHSSSVPGFQTAARQLTGEFTNKLSSLRQSLIDIASLLELELDFADEGLEFIDKSQIQKKVSDVRTFCQDLGASYKSSEILRSGYFVGIAGYPNSGKSTLFNSLLNRQRAIVSHIPGTTRDYLEETLYLDGIAIKLFDTAGIRESDDVIEIEGIKFVESILEQTNLIIILNDISISENNSDSLFEQIQSRYTESKVILVQNKTDIINFTQPDNPDKFFISAKQHYGLDNLRKFLSISANKSTERLQDILINQRHSILLNTVVDELDNALLSISENMDNVIIAIDIRHAIKEIGELTGEIWSEDILNNIFSRFCIGK